MTSTLYLQVTFRIKPSTKDHFLSLNDKNSKREKTDAVRIFVKMIHYMTWGLNDVSCHYLSGKQIRIQLFLMSLRHINNKNKRNYLPIVVLYSKINDQGIEVKNFCFISSQRYKFHTRYKNTALEPLTSCSNPKVLRTLR